MRVAIVTSQVNYVKDNYQGLINRLLSEHGSDVKAIVVVRTIEIKLFLKIIALPFLGAPRLASILAKNIFRSIFASPYSALRKQGIQIIHTKSVNDDNCYKQLQALDLDLILNVRTRNIFRERILNLPRWGCMNIHHGVLPNYRGTMCDLWALAEGRPVGYSVHWMNKKIDDGRIIKVREIKHSTLDYSEIPYLSSRAESEDLVEILSKMKSSGKIEGFENRPDNKIYTRNPSRRDIKAMRQKGVRL